MAQFESRNAEIEAAHVQALFVAAQRSTGAFSPEKYFSRNALSFPFLLDEDRAVTKAYGVYHRLGIDAINIAHPATFLIDGRGRVQAIYVSENQRERAPLEDLLKQAVWLTSA